MQSAAPPPKPARLSAMAYGSLAGPDLHEPLALAQMILQMRRANADLRVTGAISCDAGRIQQWIEGPAASVALLWDRIRLDPRHRVQWATPPAVVTARHFPGSPLKLAMTMADLSRLDPCQIEDVAMLPEASAWGCSRDSGFAKGTAWAIAPPLTAERAQAVRLAELLTAGDPLLARGQLDAVLRQIGVPAAAALVQAVLDLVQAGWMAGLTTALQRQLAVAMLQSALRLRLDGDERPQTVGCALVSALPGTPDLCGVMLKVALLRRAGWSVRLLLPRSTDEVKAVARGLQPDLIVLAGSRLSVRPTEFAMLADLLPALATPGAAPIVLGGKLAQGDGQALLRRGVSAVCGALTWIPTIAADLATTPPPPMRDPRGAAPLTRD